VVERFNRSLKYEHLYQREIADAAELAEEVASFLATYNEIRPHESLGQRRPTACIAAITTYLGPQLSKKVDTVHA